MTWVDYDDGHAGGYPHECEAVPTNCVCGHSKLWHWLERGRCMWADDESGWCGCNPYQEGK